MTAALAKFAGIEFDAQACRGKYSPKHVTPRDLPDDRLIAEWFYKIENPAWQWVYGAIATYGLRPHEVFYLDLADFPIVTVTDGKTGRRRVWPCYPEWADQFGVREMTRLGRLLKLSSVCKMSLSRHKHLQNLSSRTSMTKQAMSQLQYLSKGFTREGVELLPKRLRSISKRKPFRFSARAGYALEQRLRYTT